jgi:putative addiction module component (TIGR02574 family)
MIAELLPGLEKLTREQKWQLVEELEEELMADDPTMHEPLKSEIVRLLESRHDQFLAHPETASTVEQVSQRMRAQKKE